MWKIALADDESYIREALSSMISWESMNCFVSTVCANGQELMDAIIKEQPNIVIVDINMPLVDGLEVSRFIYENYPKIQVIILSAYSEFEYARKAIAYNVCEYVRKISILEELPKAVKKAVANLEENQAGREIEKMESNDLHSKMERYIEEHFKEKISLEKMSEELHANKSYLSRLYKEKKGINISDAILQRKVDAAKEYLRKTDLKIYEVSGKVGFDDTGYFSKVFKKYTGQSPKEFQQNGSR